MASRRTRVNKFENKKLSVNDVICPICRSILIKPITLPCSHGFCSACFETNQNANVVCPLCRVRVGSWLRSATKSNKLVNEALWDTIQTLFPVQVQKKLKGCNRVITSKNNSTNSTTKMQNINNVQIDTKSTALIKNSNVKGQNTNVKRSNLINSFATKEYTCRILCQNVNSKETQKTILKESQIMSQKKNKRIQEIKESEANDRSNSIESECLYFKPIDYKRNPPSEGLAPIKVPTRKPNVSPHFKILAPSGQNKINVNHLESAFARLHSPEEKMQISKKENISDRDSASLKRKFVKSDRKTRKRLKASHKEDETKSKEINANVKSVCVMTENKTSLSDKMKLADEEKLKKALQEQADFELAIKLQQSFNQSSQYSTRSVVLKRMAAKNPVKMDIMTQVK